MNRGTIYGFTAYFIWGLLPIYWKALADVPALQTTAHRVIWSAVFVALLLGIRGNWRWLQPALRSPRILLTFGATAALILVNWLVYIYAINAEQIVETSLGYFILPLVNVLLAVLFLHERPRPWQWLAIGIAAVGVAYLTITYGRLPWIALGLAFSFGFYGLLKKKTTVGALEGQFLETGILFLPMLIYLGTLQSNGASALQNADWTTWALVALSGVVTATPLILFSAGAQRIPLTMLGLLQYIAPTISFFLGILLYHEPFNQTMFTGFLFIWVALAIFTVESILEHRRLAFAFANSQRQRLDP